MNLASAVRIVLGSGRTELTLDPHIRYSYITPSKRDTEPSDRQFKHIVWLWERCGDLMGPGVESVVVLLDCESLSDLTQGCTGRLYVAADEFSCLFTVAGKSKRPSATLSAKVSTPTFAAVPCRVPSPASVRVADRTRA